MFPYPTIVFGNRMVRIQYEIDRIEEQNKFVLKARTIEKNLKREVERLNRIFNNYIAEFDDEEWMEEPIHPKAGLTDKAFKKMICRVMFGMGIDPDKINAMKGIDLVKLKENFKDIIMNNYNALSMGWKEFLKNKILQKLKINARGALTSTDLFTLGKRKRTRGTHPVLMFVEEFKNMVKEGSLIMKANQPFRNVLKD